MKINFYLIINNFNLINEHKIYYSIIKIAETIYKLDFIAKKQLIR